MATGAFSISSTWIIMTMSYDYFVMFVYYYCMIPKDTQYE